MTCIGEYMEWDIFAIYTGASVPWILSVNKFWFFIDMFIYLFIYLGFYIAFNTVQVISQRVVGRAEETSTYSGKGFVL